MKCQRCGKEMNTSLTRDIDGQNSIGKRDSVFRCASCGYNFHPQITA